MRKKNFFAHLSKTQLLVDSQVTNVDSSVLGKEEKEKERKKDLWSGREREAEKRER